MDSRGCPGGGTPWRDQRAQAGKGRMISARGRVRDQRDDLPGHPAPYQAYGESRVVTPPAA
jgi:hypothetical protein